MPPTSRGIRGCAFATLSTHGPRWPRSVSRPRPAPRSSTRQPPWRIRPLHGVMIASATKTHADLAMAAAARGKAIFCEKPIDLDIARTDACLAAVAQGRRALPDRLQPPLRPELPGAEAPSSTDEIGAVEQVIITSRDPEAETRGGARRRWRGLPRDDDPRLRHGPQSAGRGAGRAFRDRLIAWCRRPTPSSATTTPPCSSCARPPAASATSTTACGRATATISASRCTDRTGMLRAGNRTPTSVELSDAPGDRHRQAALLLCRALRRILCRRARSFRRHASKQAASPMSAPRMAARR